MPKIGTLRNKYYTILILNEEEFGSKILILDHVPV